MSEPRHISECITEWMTEYADIAQPKGHHMNLDPEPERATDLDAWRSVAQGDAEDRDALAAKCADLQRRLDAVTALADEAARRSNPLRGTVPVLDLRRALAGTDTDGGGE